MTYDEIIKKAGKRIKKHVYYIKNGITTYVSDESVERVKFDLQTPLIGTSMQTSEITLKEKIDGEIYVEVEAKYGSSTATKTYGAFYLKEESTYDANKKTYIHKTGDGLIKSMIDYEPLNLTYPVTIYAFFTALVNRLGYTTNIASLPNGNIQMTVDIFNNIGFTYRDVLDDIAVANGVLFYIEGNELKIATLGGNTITINDDILKNQNIEFGEHFGAINTIVLSRSGESDNIYYPAILPENPVEFKIVDNQLMNENNRDDFLPALYNQLNGIEYDIYDTELTGWGDVKPLQSVEFETGDNTYTSYIFNNEITLTEGYKQAIYNELPEETETDYKAASKTDKTINQAYIIVRKNEAEIESLASRVVDVSDTKTGTGQVQLENAHEGILHKLSISGQISLLFPQSESNLYGYPLVPSNDLVPSNTLTPSSLAPYGNEVLYPSSTLYPRGNILLIDDVEYTLDFDFLNYLSATVFDEFVYKDGECQIIRRVGINSQGNKYPLDNEVIEYRKPINLEVKSDSIIKLKSFNNAILNVEYLLENVYTDNFATQVDVSSQITQTNNKIEQTVSMVADEDGNVTSGSILLAINKDESQAKIQANKIELEGYTTINGNFKVDEEGNMEAKNGSFSGGEIYLKDDVEKIRSKFKIEDASDNFSLDIYSDQIWMEYNNNVRFSLQATSSSSVIRLDGTSEHATIGTAGISYSIGSVAWFNVSDEGTVFVRNGEYISWNQFSLEKMKKNIQKYDKKVLNLIKNSDIYEFNYKEENNNDKKHIGFIIGEGYNTPKEFISNTKESIDVSSLVGILVKAIQEQQEEIENLKKEMEELKDGFNRISK